MHLSHREYSPYKKRDVYPNRNLKEEAAGRDESPYDERCRQDERKKDDGSQRHIERHAEVPRRLSCGSVRADQRQLVIDTERARGRR